VLTASPFISDEQASSKCYGEPAIDNQGLASDLGAIFRSQKDDHAHNFLRFSSPRQRDAAILDEPFLKELRSGLVHALHDRQGSVNMSRRDRVCENPVGGQVNGQCLGMADDSPFRGSIGAQFHLRRQRLDGRDTDNAPPILVWPCEVQPASNPNKWLQC
jgi:hypothetical protein